MDQEFAFKLTFLHFFSLANGQEREVAGYT